VEKLSPVDYSGLTSRPSKICAHTLGMRTMLRLGADGPPVLASAGFTFLVLLPLLPPSAQVLLVVSALIACVALAAKRGYDSAVGFCATPWRVAARITAPIRRMLPTVVWDLRPIPIGIAAWQSASEGPTPIGAIGAVVLIGIGMLTYLSPWCRKQLGAHQVTAPVHGRGQVGTSG